MILLTRLNGNPITVNSDLIRYVEASPDTMLTLVTGEKIVVRETCHDVIEKAKDWRAGLLQSAFPIESIPTGSMLLGMEVVSTALAARSAHDADGLMRKSIHDQDE